MCGRTALTLSKDQLQRACCYKPKGETIFKQPQWLSEYNSGKEYIPSCNIAPTDITPILISSTKLMSCNPAERILKPMMWGIIPPWHEGDYRYHNLSTNNCRLENINTSKLFSPILQTGGRCIIVVEGFYEWQTTDKDSRNKKPYFIYSAQKEGIQIEDLKTWKNEFSEDTGWSGINLLFIAGLYNVWRHQETVIYSYSVITMNSNSTLSWLHHRMPAILSTQDQINAWLDIDNVKPDMALQYLAPVKILSWHQVSTSVNNSRNKSEDCNKKITLKSNRPQQKTLTSWFIKTEKRKSELENVDSASKKPKTNK